MLRCDRHQDVWNIIRSNFCSLSHLSDLVKHFFEFLEILFCTCEVINRRRNRDLNPGAAINDLLPFQGSPFNLLGTSPKKLKNYFTICIELGSSTERVGFEPTRPCGITGFQDQLHKPLGHLSKRKVRAVLDHQWNSFIRIPRDLAFVNRLF